MRYRYVIRLMKINAYSKDRLNKVIGVSSNKYRQNSGFIEKLGVVIKQGDINVYCINLKRVGYWLNKGAILKSKVAWIIEMIND